MRTDGKAWIDCDLHSAADLDVQSTLMNLTLPSYLWGQSPQGGHQS